MVSISLVSNIKSVERQLNDIGRRQLPFAVSQALTSTAFDMRKEIVERTWPRSVEARDAKFMAAALRVKKATKTKLVASVFDRLKRNFIMRQATGGMKYSRTGRHVAIPTENVKARRGARGVPKSLRPRQALEKANTFEVRTKSGQLVIMRRPRKKASAPEVLYVLEQSVRVSKRFPVFTAADQVVRRRFNANFNKAFAKAIATARR